jgi:hypothetical protein
MYYLIALFGVMAVYAAGVCLVPRMPKSKWVVAAFVALVFLPYVYCSLSIMKSAGVDDWNFKNTLPVANVSPFTFFLCPLSLVLPKRIGKYFMTMISLLSVGMLVSGAFTCIFNYMRDYTFYLTFFLDVFEHVTLSLFGVYLVYSEEASLKKRDALIGGGIIVFAAVLMLIVNLIFRTSFFGLSLYGEHNIYNNVLCESGILSAAIYFAGLIGVLALGYLYHKALTKYLYKNK